MDFIEYLFVKAVNALNHINAVELALIPEPTDDEKLLEELHHLVKIHREEVTS